MRWEGLIYIPWKLEIRCSHPVEEREEAKENELSVNDFP